MISRKPAALVLFLLAALTGIGWAQDAKPPVQGEPEIVVPEGTVLPIVLTAYLNSRSSQPGDSFYAETVYPIWISQRLVIPRGSLVKGTLTQVVRPGRIKGRGQIAVRIDNVLLPNGVSRPLIASFRGLHGPGEEKLNRKSESVEIDSSKGADTGQVVGTAATGAIIGAVADRGTGAAIGGGVGAGVGLATVLFTRGRELVLQPGTQFDLELKQPLHFAFGELEFTGQQMQGGNRTRVPAPARERNSGTNRRWIPGLPGLIR